MRHAVSDELTTVRLPAVEPGDYREVMGHYPTGVTVVTGMSPGGEPIGMVVGTFTAVSLDPPLVAFMPTTTSGTYALMRDSDAYCVNVLAHDQLDLCRLMAAPRPGKFDEVDWTMSDHGAPVLTGAVAHIHCRAREAIPAGDHYIVLCEVQRMEVARPATPLLFFQGGYGGFSPKGMAAKGDADVIAAVRLAEVVRPEVERAAATLRCEVSVLVQVNDHELTTAVSAFGGSAEMQAQLGERVPLIPPLGEAYVAWSSDSHVAAWLARVAPQSPEAIERYRARLATVRLRGYAVSRLCPESAPRYAELKGAMREYAAGELTPARERAVRSAIAEAAQFFETVHIVPEEDYDIGAIVVPVLAADGTVALCLRAAQLPRDVPGSRVAAWIATLQQAAAAAGRALERSGQGEFADYLHTFPGDFML